MQTARHLFSWKPHWARRLGPAPFLPMSREEMQSLQWDACDVVIVSGDAYVDHPSFGAAIVGRLLEAQGFRVGIIAQPDWHSPEAFRALGRPRLCFGITAGNMDSMVNHYTSDRRIRRDDAYTPGGAHGHRPDRAVLVYSQRAREAYADVPVILGGIEASLRRIAHFDYWSEKVRRSVLVDAKADLLIYGNAERALVEVVHRLASGETIDTITDLRGTACVRRGIPEGWTELDSSSVDVPGPLQAAPDPYALEPAGGPASAARRTASAAPPGEGPAASPEEGRATPPGEGPAASPEEGRATPPGEGSAASPAGVATHGRLVAGAAVPAIPLPFPRRSPPVDRSRTVLRLPSFEQVRDDPVLYAHASRVLHLESNPGNARALVQAHGDRDVFLNPPPIPLTTEEMDRIYELPYQRVPHPAYGEARIPAYDMIRFSVTIQRGCFGGCTFCSITEHEGRIIQSRSEDSIIREVTTIRDTVPGFTGVVSDLGGPTANMWRIACKSREIEAACRKPSCVYPGICPNLNTDHSPLIRLYRRARAVPGVKRVLIASGVRYDLAVESPEYVKELASHHVGGYLKIAPEAISEGPLSKMMKPGIDTYDRFKALFDRYSQAAGKQQYLIPYFIAAHPGTTDEDMLELALWLKRNGFRADQVQAFLPGPMATATAMYHTGRNPLRKVTRSSEQVVVPKGLRVRRLHKAFLRWHDPDNWPLLREALRRMGRADLIGPRRDQLIPAHQPRAREGGAAVQPARQGTARTQHCGLPTLPGAKVGRKSAQNLRAAATTRRGPRRGDGV